MKDTGNITTNEDIMETKQINVSLVFLYYSTVMLTGPTIWLGFPFVHISTYGFMNSNYVKNNNKLDPVDADADAAMKWLIQKIGLCTPSDKVTIARF